MLIARCAWHRRYYGFGRLLGVNRWGGLRIGFTDGICPKCAARVRSDFKVSRTGGRVPADRRPWLPGVAVVALAVMTAVLLIARPTHEMPLPTHVALQLSPAPAELQPAASPSLAAPAGGGSSEPRGPLGVRRASLSLRPAAPSRVPAVYRMTSSRDSAQSP